ncbi:MAG: DNA-3-methyladenine glycosylase [bacterium]
MKNLRSCYNIRVITKLPPFFYLRDTVQVARELLGKRLVRIINGSRLVGIIVETEAYCEGDAASHSFRGRTKRNDVMFWRGGHLYVYFTYGMHFCANVVTREEGAGEAVLIRAIEPTEGIERMMRNRGMNERGGERENGREGESKSVRGRESKSGREYESKKQLFNLTNGPAKLCQAFGIGREENGTDLSGNEIYIVDVQSERRLTISSSTRVGIKNGKGKKWRYYVKGNDWVST